MTSYQLSNTSKICSNIEIEENFYIFEICVSTPDNTKGTIYRKILSNKEGLLLELENNITKIKITMCTLNNINKIITIKKNFTTIITEPIILNHDNLIIKMDKSINNVFINYMIL
jgi:hypothetical protein